MLLLFLLLVLLRVVFIVDLESVECRTRGKEWFAHGGGCKESGRELIKEIGKRHVLNWINKSR